MKYNYNLELFKNKTENFYYILGTFLTDGNIFAINNTYLIQMTSKDIDWLKLLQQELCCALYPTKDGHGNLVIRSKEIGEILLDSGCLPNKSLSNKLPIIPAQYLPDFIRGCIDGDGSIPKGKQIQSYICSSSVHFLESIQLLVDIKSHIYEIKKKPYMMKNGKTITPRNKHYRLMFGTSSTKKLLIWSYYPNHLLSMPRKNIIAQQITASVNRRVPLSDG